MPSRRTVPRSNTAPAPSFDEMQDVWLWLAGEYDRHFRGVSPKVAATITLLLEREQARRERLLNNLRRT